MRKIITGVCLGLIIGIIAGVGAVINYAHISYDDGFYTLEFMGQVWEYEDHYWEMGE